MDEDEEKLICPYCGEKQYTHEPDEISSFCCITKCEHCGKQFEYAVDVTRNYYPRKFEGSAVILVTE